MGILYPPLALQERLNGNAGLQIPVSNHVAAECGRAAPTPLPSPSPSPNLATPSTKKREGQEEGPGIGSDKPPLAECSKTPESVAPVHSSKSFTPLFLKRRKTQEGGGTVGKEKAAVGKEEKAAKAANATDGIPGEAKKAGEVAQVQPQRPSNPFARPAANQEEQPSLFDSIKKMKKPDNSS